MNESEKIDPRELSPLALAFVGDSVLELRKPLPPGCGVFVCIPLKNVRMSYCSLLRLSVPDTNYACKTSDSFVSDCNTSIAFFRYCSS